MLSYCLVCKRNTGNKDANMIKTKQEAKGLLSNLGIRTPLSSNAGLNVLF